MTQSIHAEVSAMERSFNSVTMTDSQRLVATAAMRNGFMLVDACERLAHAAAAVFTKRRVVR